MAANITRLTPSARPSAPGSGRPSGGHTEPAGNNLSFPVIWTDGVGLTLPGSPGSFSFTTAYDVNGDGSITTADQLGGYYQFGQKTIGNVWQAQSYSASAPVYVTEVDWGDSLESVDMKVGRPVRIELSLYKTLTGTDGLPSSMLSFPMTLLANASSPDEQQGAGATAVGITGTLRNSAGDFDPLLDSRVNAMLLPEAAVYSTKAHLVIQKIDGSRDDIAAGDLLWDGSQWVDNNAQDLMGATDIFDPITGTTFAGELNVGGKVIYGLSQGGWRPRETGDYRITFYIDPGANAQLEGASIRQPIEEEIAAIAAEEGSDTGGGTAYVVGANNLTYIDIRVVSGGGGGGGGGGRPRSASDILSLGATDVLRSFSSDPLLAQFQSPSEQMREQPNFQASLAVRQSEFL